MYWDACDGMSTRTNNDHITSAIGSAITAHQQGRSFVITHTIEHLAQPCGEDVKHGDHNLRSQLMQRTLQKHLRMQRDLDDQMNECKKEHSIGRNGGRLCHWSRDGKSAFAMMRESRKSEEKTVRCAEIAMRSRSMNQGAEWKHIDILLIHYCWKMNIFRKLHLGWHIIFLLSWNKEGMSDAFIACRGWKENHYQRHPLQQF